MEKHITFVAIFIVCMAFTSCNKKYYCDTELPTSKDVPNTTMATENPYRSQYLVDSITWYDSPDNHKEAKYIYDDDNKLIRRVLTGQILEAGIIRDFRYETEFEYSNGLVSSIIEDGRVTTRLYYDNQDRITKMEHYGRDIFFHYLNGKVVSMYEGEDVFSNGFLVYDKYGDVVKYVLFAADLNPFGEPIDGTCHPREYNFTYDHGVKPNFGLDYLFVYQPIPGMGTAVPAYARELSLSNMTSYYGFTWTYTYNELGLPVTIRERFDGVTPVNDPHYTIYYKKK